MAEDVPLLAADDLHKRFGGVHALRGVSLEVRRGEVHALVGENGSGKSTLLRILSGQIQADHGRVYIDGRATTFADPKAALRQGIAMVSQETALAPNLTVAENILLGRRMVRSPRGIRWAATRRRAQAILDELGLDLHPSTRVERLRPDEQQMVEIARALSARARVVVLDEPTSSLTDDEVASLFEAIRGLTRTGVAVLFVSHRMAEIFAIAGRVTVLRDGRTVDRGPLEAYDEGQLIEAMVGRRLERVAPTGTATRTRGRGRPSVLRLSRLSVADRVHDLDLELAQGEIVGLAGLVGAGRSEVFSAIFGLEPSVRGEMEFLGRPVRVRSPVEAIRLGVGYVPPDRQRQGIVPDMSVQRNLALPASAGQWRLRTPRMRQERRAATGAVDRFGIVTPSLRARVVSLSGGNQQKVVLAKWMTTRPALLLLDEPTRGVDVGAKSEIYALIAAAKRDGVALLVSSSETPELLRIADRIVVMFRGRVRAELAREEATEARIAHYAVGGD